jgi:hypothetical protein
MHGTGYIVQYSSTEKRGTIHMGGDEHFSLLPFAFSDCERTVQTELIRGQLAGGSAVKVQFEIALRKGSLVATNISPEAKKSAAAAKVRSRTSSRRKKTPAAKRGH